MEEEVDLSELNHTELVQLAQWLGLPASRGVPRDDLILSIENLSPLAFTSSTEEMRTKLMSWLTRHWEKIQMQAAKKVCPRCNLCRDAQVLECYTKNRRYL